MNDKAAECGTGFAFPCQTLYTGRDEGLDEERSDSAAKRVDAWRKSGTLPFPAPTEKQIEKTADTLVFPPRGSPSAGDPQK